MVLSRRGGLYKEKKAIENALYTIKLLRSKTKTKHKTSEHCQQSWIWEENDNLDAFAGKIFCNGN